MVHAVACDGLGGNSQGPCHHLELLAASSLAGAAAAVGHRASAGASRHRAARRAIADAFECVLLDCDGVLWRGAELIEGSAKAVLELRESGKRIRFVTNASAPSRADLSRRIEAALGVPISPEEVINSGSVAAAAAAARGVRVAFCLGAEGLREEMRLAGIEVLEPSLPEPFDEAAFGRLAEGLPPVGAVVVGHDEAITYSKLAAASLFLQRGGEACAFIGTNPDVANRDPAGYLVPEAGTIIAAVEAASGRRATVVGKPAPEVILQLLDRFSLSPDKVLMVGDRLDTDIRFGAAGGARTCLVLSGVSTLQEAEALPAPERPDHVAKDLAQVVRG